jgi:hypothetical protein
MVVQASTVLTVGQILIHAMQRLKPTVKLDNR